MLTQSATTVAPTSEQAPSGTPTSAIPDSYDSTGKQAVDDGVFDFDVTKEEKEETPLVTNLDEQEDASDPTPDNPGSAPTKTPEQEAQEKADAEAKAKADQETKDGKTAEPAKPQTELKTYAGKFKDVQELKNSFIELGGDPEQFKDDVGQLEQAYLVRQREYSRVRAEISHADQVPPETPKSVNELLMSEFSQVDPDKFSGPSDMMAALIKGFSNVLQKVQQPVAPTQNISPEQMARQIKVVENMHSIETKVPRLKSDQQFRQAFATHIRQMRDENRIPKNAEGFEDLHAVMKDFIGGQRALIDEASKSYADTEAAKAVTTATSSDNGGGNPASAPKANPDEQILDDILGYHTEYNRKYNYGNEQK